VTFSTYLHLGTNQYSFWLTFAKYDTLSLVHSSPGATAWNLSMIPYLSHVDYSVTTPFRYHLHQATWLGLLLCPNDPLQRLFFFRVQVVHVEVSFDSNNQSSHLYFIIQSRRLLSSISNQLNRLYRRTLSDHIAIKYRTCCPFSCPQLRTNLQQKLPRSSPAESATYDSEIMTRCSGFLYYSNVKF